jgi:hypothetical protein
MEDSVLLGVWRLMLPIPRAIWQREVGGVGHLEFMSADHHRVRNFVVNELPRAGEPLAPEFIARELGLPLARVAVVLEELERHKTFLFRNEQGAVEWAYPVTATKTPHGLTFSGGEQIHAA